MPKNTTLMITSRATLMPRPNARRKPAKPRRGGLVMTAVPERMKRLRQA